MENIKVSVIMPVYNAEKYLRQALDTVINQTLPEIEIICVDDGSSDHSWSILSEYAKKDSRIKLLKQEETSDGAALARNMGLKYATGEYLSFLDADDFFEFNMLDILYNNALTNGADVILYDAWNFDDATQQDREFENAYLRKDILPSKDVFTPEEGGKRLFQISVGAAWTALFCREMIVSKGITFDSVHRNDDCGFVYTALAAAAKISVIRKRLLHYRTNISTSQSANMEKWPESPYIAHKLLKQKLQVLGLYEKFKIPFANRFLSETLYNIRTTESPEVFLFAYKNLKEVAMQEFEIDKLTAETIARSEWMQQLKIIREYPPEAYFIVLRKYNRLHQESAKIVLPFDKSKRIVIYGAGVQGIKWFNKLFKERYNVVGWLDRNAKIIGFPVRGPEALSELKTDWVLVAIENEVTFLKVRDFLMMEGIKSEYIFWPF